METNPSISDSEPEGMGVSEDWTSQPQPWTATNTVPPRLARLNLPDLDELDKKYRYMQPDLVRKYKHAALQAADPLTYGLPEDVDDGPVSHVHTGISQADIVARAFSLYTVKYPYRASIAINPPPPKKFKPRWDDFTDIDKMDQPTDDEQPTPPKRGRKPKEVENVEESEQSEPPTRGTKRKAVDDLVVVADNAAVESRPNAPTKKKPRVDSDKENNLILRRKDETKGIVPYRPAGPVRKSLPTAMNVAKKRTVKEIDAQPAEPAKRMKYGAPQDVMETSQALAARDSAVRREDGILTPLQAFRAKALGADNGPELTKGIDAVGAVAQVKQHRQQFPTHSFSDGGGLFEELLNRQVDDSQGEGGDIDDIGDVILEDPSGNAFAWTATTSISVPSSPKAIQQASPTIPTSTNESTPIPSSLASPPNIRPSLRDKPMQILDQRSDVTGSQSGRRIITCFRVAEALRLRTTAISAPKPLSQSLDSSPALPVELYARIHLTYRDSATQVFVFEDVFFPNKMPFLRAIHRSWQQCEREAPALLRRNAQSAIEGGFLCRVVVELDTNSPELASDPLQGEVTDLRVAEWSEIKRVRGVVDPKYQDE